MRAWASQLQSEMAVMVNLRNIVQVLESGGLVEPLDHSVRLLVLGLSDRCNQRRRDLDQLFTKLASRSGSVLDRQALHDLPANMGGKRFKLYERLRTQ